MSTIRLNLFSNRSCLLPIQLKGHSHCTWPPSLMAKNKASEPWR